MSKRAPIHTKASATLAMRAGGELWMYIGMYNDPPSAEIRDASGARRTVRYETANALITEMVLIRDQQASSWGAKKFAFRGAA